jgi:hypothetical protein
MKEAEHHMVIQYPEFMMYLSLVVTLGYRRINSFPDFRQSLTLCKPSSTLSCTASGRICSTGTRTARVASGDAVGTTLTSAPFSWTLPSRTASTAPQTTTVLFDPRAQLRKLQQTTLDNIGNKSCKRLSWSSLEECISR